MLHDPTFWVLVAFVIFMVLVYKPISKAAATALDKRADQIKEELDEAERLREEAQGLLAEYERKLKEAAREAEGIVASAREEADRMSIKAKEALEASLARAEKQANDRIAQVEQQATQEVRSKAVDIAVAAAGAVLAEQVAGPRGATLVDSAIQAIPGKLH